MDVADVFWASATDSGEDSGAEPDEAEPPGKGAFDLDEGGRVGRTDAPAADSEASPARAALETPAAAELAAWPHLLQEAGFSRTEAARLIFERLCPRDEGRTRT